MPITVNKTNIRVPLKTYNASWKIVYIDTDGNEVVISDNTTTDGNVFINGSFTRRTLRYGVGNFNINLFNNSGTLNPTYTKAMRIKVYADHVSSNPTNQIFDCRIDSIKHSLVEDNKFIMSLYGRGNPQLVDKHITKDFSSGATAIAAIQNIIDTEFLGIFTYINIDPNMTGTIYGEYINQSGLSVISDILKQVGYDGYIDFNNDIHTFVVSSQKNTRER